MIKCANCGVDLYALNMSDNDWTLCQKCDEEIIFKLTRDSLDTTLVLWDGQMNRKGI